nr:uncharacterized protein LOC112489567 [Ziziphus jujuba var. spinosa]
MVNAVFRCPVEEVAIHVFSKHNPTTKAVDGHTTQTVDSFLPLHSNQSLDISCLSDVQLLSPSNETTSKKRKKRDNLIPPNQKKPHWAHEDKKAIIPSSHGDQSPTNDIHSDIINMENGQTLDKHSPSPLAESFILPLVSLASFVILKPPSTTIGNKSKTNLAYSSCRNSNYHSD